MAKQKDKKKAEFYTEIAVELFKDISLSDVELDVPTVRAMLEDIDVSTLVNKISRTVASREFQVWTDNEALKDKAKEIASRFSQVKFNRVFENILQARYYGFACFEKVYNEDYSLKSLMYIPPEFLYYDITKNKWYVKAGTEEKEITYDKFILAINKYNVAHKMGISEFSGVKKCFADKTMFRRQLRVITQRYGEIIFVFAYDPTDYNNQEAKLEAKVKQIRAMKRNTVIAVPYIDGTVAKDSINLIKLSDLQPQIYNNLEDKEIEKITQNMLGGTLTINNGSGTGSYSLGAIHQDAFEQVVKVCCNFITDSLYNLIEYDAQFFGYNAKDFYFRLEPFRDISQEAEVQQKQETVKATKLDNMIKLYSLGVGLNSSYIAQELGIDEKELVEVKQQENTAEFAKKKILTNYSTEQQDKLIKR